MMRRRRHKRAFIEKTMFCAECGNEWTYGALVGNMREDEQWSCKCSEFLSNWDGAATQSSDDAIPF